MILLSRVQSGCGTYWPAAWNLLGFDGQPCSAGPRLQTFRRLCGTVFSLQPQRPFFRMSCLSWLACACQYARRFVVRCASDICFLRTCRLRGECVMNFLSCGRWALPLVAVGQYMLVLHLLRNDFQCAFPFALCSYMCALATVRAVEYCNGWAIHIVQCRGWTVLAIGVSTVAMLSASKRMIQSLMQRLLRSVVPQPQLLCCRSSTP